MVFEQAEQRISAELTVEFVKLGFEQLIQFSHPDSGLTCTDLTDQLKHYLLFKPFFGLMVLIMVKRLSRDTMNCTDSLKRIGMSLRVPQGLNACIFHFFLRSMPNRFSA